MDQPRPPGHMEPLAQGPHPRHERGPARPAPPCKVLWAHGHAHDLWPHGCGCSWATTVSTEAARPTQPKTATILKKKFAVPSSGPTPPFRGLCCPEM